MNIYQISIRPRHRRYMFFVDENYPYDELYKLIIKNQSMWGGRYNPIIPVVDGKIAPGYIEIIKHYDPDSIFYSATIDPEMLRQLRLFNPSSFVNMDIRPRIEDISGVNTFFFLTEFDSNAKVLLPEKVWPQDSLLPSFYELNFGLSDTPYHHENEMSKRQIQERIDGEKFRKLNKIIHVEKPINVASLSRKKVNTRILRNLEHAQCDDFEIVVAKDRLSNSDLMYYWNRGLYQHKNLMYLILDQLNELSQDKYFGGVLHDLQGDTTIHVVSGSLSKEEVEEIIEKKFRPIAFNSRFRHKDISAFPYKVLDGNGLYERNYGETVTTQTLVSDTGLIHIPKLSFGGTPVYLGQAFVLDLKISQDFAAEQKQMLFPLTTESRYIAKELSGRVNLTKNLSVYLDSQKNQADVFQIVIPSFTNLARQLICSPVINGEQTIKL
jgi:hypothetical protein